ncbi:MAG: right-handed parallel beta-helix repeat-containing protein [Bacteroidetes bacterium]|nr:right-handed parallel beta-helix repeat-containing protein [Bacteroidota bacterium]
MKRIFTSLVFSWFIMNVTVMSQIYLPLTDNMVISGNSMIKVAAGNYIIQDAGQDGLIQINNASNVIIDGDSVEVNGVNYSGYAIRINNSDHIQIKNFTTVNHFYYAVYITNSNHILINNCNFSYNKVDSSGWISVWTGYTSALGGGVMAYNCDSINVYGNLMKYQNDGVALYNCKKAMIHYNDFAWNTSYGIRMYFTDSSSINNNNCAHVNRPLTDPSDCAALLMIVSNVNRVEFNDLSYSGDGVFLGQYQYSTIPNNNYFAYNDCSGSPHNAIEATFADGNVYKHNLCNESQYGLWLGYSFNSVVDSNQIMYNTVSGIAVDRGINNQFTNNWIVQNPQGVELWEGSPPATGYTGFTSHDYRIDSNLFEGNSLAITASSTDHMLVRDNQFIKNYEAIYFEGVTTQDTITRNLFDRSLTFDMSNNSANDIPAVGNLFTINDTSFISAKINDKQDTASHGSIFWKPFTGMAAPVYDYTPPAELTEYPSTWYTYPEICWWLGIPEPMTITFDSVVKKTGGASVHLVTGTGWYNTCSYRDTGNIVARWDLSNYGYLRFWIKSTNTNLGAFQYFHVRIGNLSGGYFRYNSTGSILNQSLGVWKQYTVPLYGNASWPVEYHGNISLSDIDYVEVCTDSYGVGYELWLDGMEFLMATEVEAYPMPEFSCELFPNPASDIIQLNLQLPENEFVNIDCFDLSGNIAAHLYGSQLTAGEHVLPVGVRNFTPGIYIVQIQAGRYSGIRKLSVIR